MSGTVARAARTWATCDACRREMAPGGGCTVKREVLVGGEVADRVPFGSERRFGDDPLPAADRCPDCNVAPGRMHHPGCDWEECPRCGGQALGCECYETDEAAALAAIAAHQEAT